MEQGRKDISRKQDYQLQPIELDTIIYKNFLNSTKEIEQHKKEKLYYTYKKLGHLAQEHYKKPMEQNSRKKIQRQTRKTTREVNTLEVVKGRGVYNSPKELNVINRLL